MKKWLLLLVALIALALPVAAKQPDLKAKFNEFAARLELNNEQKQKLQPILADALEAQRATLKRFRIELGVDTPIFLSQREVGQLRKALEKTRSKTEKQVRGFLSESQMTEFIEAREEAADEVREEIRRRYKFF